MGRQAMPSSSVRSGSGLRPDRKRAVAQAIRPVIENLETRIHLAITSPAALVALPSSMPGGTAAISVLWLDKSNNETNFVVERRTDSTQFAQIATVDANVVAYNDSSITAGTHYTYQVKAINSTEGSGYTNSADAIEWTTANVGTVTGGSATMSGSGSVSITTKGGGIGGSSDDFRYVYRTLPGDGYIVARIDSVQYAAAASKGAIMFRDTLAANSKEVALTITAGNGAEYIWRRTAGSSVEFQNYAGNSAPKWLKIVREGSLFSAYLSSDGTSWTLMRQVNVSMGSNIYVGVAASASAYGADSTSAFSNVAVTRTDHSLPTGWSDQDLGSVPSAGSARYYGDTFTFCEESTGQNIEGTADAFHFAHKTLAGDGEVIARVAAMVGMDGGSPASLAKAGVMLRDGTAAGARNVFLAITGGSSALWQNRSTTNGSTSVTTQTGVSIPRWVKIRRVGNTFTGYLSTDGSTWSQIGSSVTISGMPSSLEVGLGLSAAAYGNYNTTTFDHVSAAPATAGPIQNLPAPSVQEGATYELPSSSFFEAPAAGITYTVSVNWGDGHTSTGTTVSEADGAGSFKASLPSISHPFARPGDLTVSITATNSNDSSDTTTGTFTAEVAAVAPVLKVGAASDLVLAGQAYTIDFHYYDVGDVNVDSITVNWGDGSDPQVISGHPDSASHVYTQAGYQRTITVTPHDSDFPDGLPAATLSYDASFGTSNDGSSRVHLNQNQWNEVAALARDSQGRILSAGQLDDGTIGVVRLNTDGSLDTTFGNQSPTSGLAVINPGTGFTARAAAITLDSQGRIYVAGDVFSTAGSYDFAVARLTADGAMDTTFGTGGIATTDFGSVAARANAIAIATNGKITLAGFAGPDLGLASYTSSGAPDTTFGDGGQLTVNLGATADIAYTVKIDSSKRIVVAGRSGTDMVVARFYSDGSPDDTFGTDQSGAIVFDVGASDYAYDIAFDSQKRIVVAGSADSHAALARLTADGQLDTSFSSVGWRIDNDFAPSAYNWRVTVGAKDTIVTSGSLDLAQYLADGTRDVNFGNGGAITWDPVEGVSALRLASVFTNDQGRITVAGQALGAGYDLMVLRLLPGNRVTVDTHGLSATFWDNPDFSGTSASRVDDTVDFEWTTGQSPITGIAATSYSAQWSGQLLAPATGSYSFDLAADDGAMLWVGDQPVVSQFTDGDDLSTTVNLVAGARYNVRLLYRQDADAASVHLRWTVPGQTEAVTIPTDDLFATAIYAPDAPATPALFRGSVPLATDIATNPRATLSWASAANATRYIVYRSVDSGQTFVPVGVSPGTYTSYTDGDVSLDGRYAYRLVAAGAGGLAQATQALDDSKVDNVEAVNAGDGVVVSWQGGEGNVEVQRSEDSGATWGRVAAAPAPAGQVVVPMEAPSDDLFRVASVSDIIQGAVSASAAPATVPTPVHATFFGAPTLSGPSFTYDIDSFSRVWNTDPRYTGQTQAAVPSLIPTQHFSAILTAKFKPSVSGNYIFRTTANGGVRLSIRELGSDRKIDHWQDVPSLPYDITGDGAVKFEELVAVAQNYNGEHRTRAQGDLSGDGKVDFTDLVDVAQNYNHSEQEAVVDSGSISLSADTTYNLDFDYVNDHSIASLNLACYPVANGQIDTSEDKLPAMMANAEPVTTAPSEPTSLHVSQKTTTTVTLGWTDNANNEDGFVVERKGGGSDQWVAVGTAAANVMEYPDSGLRPNTAYTYRVKAFNRIGPSSYSDELNVTTNAASNTDNQPPGAPGTISTARKTSTSIFLKWVPSTADVSYYRISRSGGETGTVTFTRTSPNLADTGLSAGTQYSYDIVAYDAVGNFTAATTYRESTASQLPAPDLDSSNQSATVAWTAVTDATGYVIMRDGRWIAQLDDEVTSWTESDSLYGTHGYTVAAVGADGNYSPPSAVVSVQSDGSDAATPTDSAPYQYIPQEWKNYFYNTLTPALRDRFVMVPAPPTAFGGGFEPPPAQGWFDATDSVYNPANNTWGAPVFAGKFYDLDGNGFWNPGEPAWLDQTGGTANQYDSGEAISGLPRSDSIPVGLQSNVSSCQALVWLDWDKDGAVDRSELVVPDSTFYTMKGITGDLYAFPVDGSLVVWKDGDNDGGVFSGGDSVVVDKNDFLANADRFSQVIQGHQWVRFYDADGDTHYTMANASTGKELIWEDSTSPRRMSSTPATAFRSEVVGAIGAVAEITQYFKKGTSNLDLPCVMDNAGLGAISGTGTVTWDDSGQLIGTGLAGQVQVGDWITTDDGGAYLVSNISGNEVDVVPHARTGATNASFSIHNWRSLPTGYGLSTTRGEITAEGPLTKENLQDLGAAIGQMTELAPFYDVARFDSSTDGLLSSAKFLDAATKVINAYRSLYGEAPSLEMAIKAGAGDPGALIRKSYVNSLRSMVNTIAGAVNIRGTGQNANNGWTVDPNNSSHIFTFDEKRQDYLGSNDWDPIDPGAVFGDSTLGPSPWNPWDSGLITTGQRTELSDFIGSIVDNGLWIHSTITSVNTTENIVARGTSGATLQWNGNATTWPTATPGTLAATNAASLVISGSASNDAHVDFGSAQVSLTTPSATRAQGQDFAGISFGSNDQNPSWLAWGHTEDLVNLTATQVLATIAGVSIQKPADNTSVSGSTNSAGLLISWTAWGATGCNSASLQLNAARPQPQHELYGQVNLGSYCVHDPLAVSSPTLSSSFGTPPSTSIPLTTELDYRNVVPDSETDDIVEVGADLSSFGADTGSMMFEVRRNQPQAYLPLANYEDGRVPIHAYLVQGGFAASNGADILLSHDLDSPFSRDEGQPYAYSLGTHVRTNLLLNDGTNHIKRMEVIRPRGNAVVFNFSWDNNGSNFGSLGLPMDSDTRDGRRLYVLRAQPAGTYDLLFPSGVIHHFGADGTLASVELGNGWSSGQDIYDNNRYRGLVMPSLTGTITGAGSARSPKYDVSINWKNGRIDSLDYLTRESSPKTMTTALVYQSPGTVISSITSLQKKVSGTNVNAFSYTFDPVANTITNDGTVWTRTSSGTSSLTLSRSLGDSSRVYTAQTSLNEDQLPTQLTESMTGSGSVRTTYTYNSGTSAGRFSNGMPKWGKVQSVTYPDGSWQKFVYDTDSGWIRKVYSPFKGSTLPAGGAVPQDSESRVTEYNYFEPDGTAGETATPQKSIYLTDRPRRVVTRVAGCETSRTFYKYFSDVTITRPGTVGATWADSQGLESVTKYTFGASQTTTSTTGPTGGVTQTVAPTGTSRTVTTIESGPDGTALTQDVSVFNAFGGMISSTSTDEQTSIIIGQSTASASVFGFGRIGSVANMLTGQTSSNTYNPGDWYGPSSITDEDHTQTNLNYTSWGTVSNRTTFDIATSYDFDALGNVIRQTDTGGGISLSSEATFDVLSRPLSTKDVTGRTTTFNYQTGTGTNTVTTTLPDSKTVIDTSYLDGTPLSESGTAAYASAYDVGASAGAYWVMTSTNNGQSWTKTTYNSLGQVAKVDQSGPTGNTLTTQFEYDGLGRLKKQTNPDGTVTLTQYDETRGYAADSIFDIDKTDNSQYTPGKDRLSSYALTLTTGSDSKKYFVATTTNHADRSSPSQVPDANPSPILSETWTSIDGFKQINKAFGLSTTTEWSPLTNAGAGTLTTTKADGTQTKATYDKRLVQSVAQLGTDGSTISFQSYGYDALGRGTSSASTFGSTSTASLTTGLAYGSNHAEVASMTLPGNRTYTVGARWARDGRPTSITRPDTKITSINVNDQGQTSGVSGAGEYTQSFGFYADGTLDAITTPKGGDTNGATVTTNWDINPYNTSLVDAERYPGTPTGSSDVRNTFNSVGQLGQSVFGSSSDRVTLSLHYTNTGEIDSWNQNAFDGSSTIGGNIPDTDRDVQDEVWESSYTSTLPSSTNTATIEPAVTYDTDDRVSTESTGVVADVQTHYEYYDPGSNEPGASPGELKKVSVEQDGTELYSLTYEYDPITRRLATVRVSAHGTSAASFDYNYKPGTNLVASIDSAPAGAESATLNTTFGYDNIYGRLNQISQIAGTDTLYDVTYSQFNDIDQRRRADVSAAKVDFRAPGSLQSPPTQDEYSWLWDYYDTNADQLKSAKKQYFSGTNVTDTKMDLTYAYDGIGNRTSVTDALAPTGQQVKSFAANDLNQYTANPYANNAAMSYDSRGNLTDDGTWLFGFDASDRMVSATPKGTPVNGSVKLEFGYDDQGQRAWKKTYTFDSAANNHAGAWQLTGHRKFAYDGDNLVAEFEQDEHGVDRLIESYAWGPGGVDGAGELLLITTFDTDGATPLHQYRPLIDGQWNIVGLADLATGKLVARYEYDPYGNRTLEQGLPEALAANPFGWGMLRWDAEIGQYHTATRQYDPQFGRFTTRDPIAEEGGVNVYEYSQNDPINRGDPEGLDDVLVAPSAEPTLGDRLWAAFFNGNPIQNFKDGLAGLKLLVTNPSGAAQGLANSALAIAEKNLSIVESANRNPPSFIMGHSYGWADKLENTILAIPRMNAMLGDWIGDRSVGQRVKLVESFLQDRRAETFTQQVALLNKVGGNFDARAFADGRDAGYATWEAGNLALILADPLVIAANATQQAAARANTAASTARFFSRSRSALREPQVAGARLGLINEGTPGAMVMQKTDNTCVAACVQQVLREEGVAVSQFEVVKNGVWIRDKGLDIKSVEALMNERSSGWVAHYVDDAPGQLEAIAAVSGESPFIARIGFGRGHAVLVDGIEAGQVLVRDPATGMAGRIGIEEFRSIFTGVIRKK